MPQLPVFTGDESPEKKGREDEETLTERQESEKERKTIIEPHEGKSQIKTAKLFEQSTLL